MLTSKSFEKIISSAENIVFVTHSNCADGNMATILFSYYVANKTKYEGLAYVEAVQYDTPEHLDVINKYANKDKYGDVTYVFCDMTPPASQVELYLDQCNTVVIDHHAAQASSVKMFGDRGLYSDKPGMCGATLLASLVCNSLEMLPWYQAAVTIGIRDTWAKELVGYNDELWQQVSNTSEAVKFLNPLEIRSLGELSKSIETLSPALRRHRTEGTARLLCRKATRELAGLGIAFFPSNNISDVADACTEDLVVGYGFFEHDSLTVSLRARTSHIHCGELAKKINPNGGGHRGAGGFKIPVAGMNKVPIDYIFDKLSEVL